jgi:adenosylcobyric acid synthase
MLGHTIHDPEGLEGAAASMKGLGLLNIETMLMAEKTLTRITAIHVASGQKIDGYEIHLGASQGKDCATPFARIGNHDDGAISADGLVSGTYIHGCFASDGFRSAYLKSLGVSSSNLAFESLIEKTLDELTTHLEQHLDLDRMLELAGGI